MAETEKDQKTEDATPKKRREAVQKGDVLQSRELGTAMVVMAGAIWLAMAGPLMVGSLQNMLVEALTFDSRAVTDFRPDQTFLQLLGLIAVPMIALFAITIIAAVATPAMLGSLGFRSSAFAFKAEKMNPLNGIKKIFGIGGLIELVKSIAKVLLIGSIGIWLIMDQSRSLIGLSAQEIRPALASLGNTLIFGTLLLAFALGLIAMIDVPAQFFQRTARLKMSKQEVKDEHKQSEGSPEVKAQIRRRQMEVLRASVRPAMAEATVVLTNPTHYAVALRYRPGEDAAPLVVARGRGATAEVIRDLADEYEVPMLSYPQLARAIYYTAQTGHVIREDLYMAVATVLAFVFNLEVAVATGTMQPAVEVPPEARFDSEGRPEV